MNELVDASKEMSQEPVIVGKVTGEDIDENVVQPISVTVDVAAPIVARTITCVPQKHTDSNNCNTVFDHGPEMFILDFEARNHNEATQVFVTNDYVGSGLKKKGDRVRMSSCPPRVARSLESGPWSLEWISDQHHGHAGVISSSRKKVKKVVRPRGPVSQSGTIDKKRKKVDGVLHHFVHSLKKVARLPSKDRSSVLKILRKKVRQRQGSDRLKKAVDIVSQNNSDGTSSVSCAHTLIIHRRFIKSNEEFYLFNIYASCDVLAIKLLWDTLTHRLQQLRGKKVCVCGDFNDVRSREERRYVSVSHFFSDYTHFNLFIADNFLLDLPLGGRKFTWFKKDGKSMSRLDRFLLSDNGVCCGQIVCNLLNFEVYLIISRWFCLLTKRIGVLDHPIC